MHNIFSGGEDTVKFHRVSLKSTPKWLCSDNTMKEMRVMDLKARIEDSDGIQVDFANKCVQINTSSASFAAVA